MFRFQSPEPIALLLEDTSGNYAAVTDVDVTARRLLPGRTTLRGDEAVEFTMTVTSVAAATGWQGGWKAEAPITGEVIGRYIASAVLTFPGGTERVDCPFEIAA